MNLFFKEFVDLYAHPQNYTLEFDGSIIPLSGSEVGVRRSNNYIEFIVKHNGAKYLLTIAMTSGYLERCEAIESGIARMATTLFTPFTLHRCRISSAAGNFMAKVFVQPIPEGRSLVEYIDGCDEERVNELYGAIRYLEERLSNMRASFSTLLSDDVVVGDDGLIYPFRYHKLRFYHGDEPLMGCSALRNWLYNNSSIEESRSITPRLTYLNRELYEGHLYSGTPHEDRVVVEDTTGYGYVDSDNSPVIPSVYLWADDFREGRAEVQTAEGFGVIDTDGKVVIAPIYESIGYNDATGITRVRKDDLWAYFSYVGSQLTPFTDEYPDEDITMLDLIQRV